jgi:hypothetical protein
VSEGFFEDEDKKHLYCISHVPMALAFISPSSTVAGISKTLPATKRKKAEIIFAVTIRRLLKCVVFFYQSCPMVRVRRIDMNFKGQAR